LSHIISEGHVSDDLSQEHAEVQMSDIPAFATGANAMPVPARVTGQPSVSALSEHGLTMVFAGHVTDAQQCPQAQQWPQQQEAQLGLAEILADTGASHCYIGEASVRKHGLKTQAADDGLRQ